MYLLLNHVDVPLSAEHDVDPAEDASAKKSFLKLESLRGAKETIEAGCKPTTKPYFISPRLPSNLHCLRLCIACTTCCVGDDESASSEAYLKISLIRSEKQVFKQNAFDDGMIYNIQHEQPENFANVFQDQGWKLVDLSDHASALSLKVLDLAATSKEEHKSIYLGHKRPEQVSQLEDVFGDAREGDRIVVWVSVPVGLRVEVGHVRMTHCVLGIRQPSIEHEQARVLEQHQEQEGRGSESTQLNPPNVIPAGKQISYGLENNHSISSGNQTDAVLQQLQKTDSGQWTIYECSTEGSHSNALASLDDPVLRGVDNPCSHYADVPRDKKDLIRLLEIVPAAKGAPINIIIHTRTRTALRNQHSFFSHYAALSYTWGDLRKTKSITLNHVYQYPDSEKKRSGFCLRHSYNVTENLHAMLCRLRDRPFSRLTLFWIDALSIDQTNVDERSQLVQAIGEVYAESQMVLVWLNAPASEDNEFSAALSSFQDVLKDKKSEMVDPTNSIPRYMQIFGRQNSQGEGVKYLLGLLERLLQLPWFRRIWVVQEIFSANLNAVVVPSRGPEVFFSTVIAALCVYLKGSESHSSGTAPNLWYSLISRLKNPENRLKSGVNAAGKNEITFLCPHEHRNSQTDEDRMDILHLFKQAIDFDCTDPRDKVFALLGLAKPLRSPDIAHLVRPDYTKTTSHVYTSFSKACIMHHRNLDILSVTALAANPIVMKGRTGFVPPGYNFPPEDHPTWALWHAGRYEFFKFWDYGEARYNRLSCEGTIFSSHNDLAAKAQQHPRRFHFDHPSLFGNDQIPHQLPATGVFLDDIEAIFPVCFTSHNHALAGDEAHPVSCTLHKVWDFCITGLYDPAAKTFLSLEQQTIRNPEAEAKLFSQFLRTVLCDTYLPELHLDDSSPAYKPTYAEISKDPISDFIVYWLSTQDIATTGKNVDEPLTIEHYSQALQTSKLPQPVIDIWQEMLPAIVQPGDQCKRQERARDKLHHIIGRWFFRTKSGKIGHCPVGARAGDRLVALYGAQHASVLRSAERQSSPSEDPAEPSRGHWMFVGEAFVGLWVGGRHIDKLLDESKASEQVWTLV